MPPATARTMPSPRPFSLTATCGPVAWGGGRWPNIDWRDGGLCWVGWVGDRVVWRAVRQLDRGALRVEGTAPTEGDWAWALRVLGLGERCPPFEDGTVEALRRRYPGLRAFAYGSLFEGLVVSIVGQSISVAAAAVAQSRLAARYAAPVEAAGRRFWPLPAPTNWRTPRRPWCGSRESPGGGLEAIVAAGRAALDGRPRRRRRRAPAGGGGGTPRPAPGRAVDGGVGAAVGGRSCRRLPDRRRGVAAGRTARLRRRNTRSTELSPPCRGVAARPGLGGTAAVDGSARRGGSGRHETMNWPASVPGPGGRGGKPPRP